MAKGDKIIVALDVNNMEEMEKLPAEGRLSEKLICMSDALEDMKGYIADQELMDKVLYGQPLTGKVLEDKKIQSGKTERYGKFIRIIDSENNLLAVMGIEKNSDVYDYCCVFQIYGQMNINLWAT